MTSFWLVRHGAYPLLDHALGGRADHPLSDEGRAQAARAASSLADRGISAVASSPVARAWQTAQIIAERLGLKVEAAPDLAEIEFGVWTGTRFDSLDGDPAWRAWNCFRSTAGPPGGETMLAVQARAVATLQRLASRRPSGEIVLVSHADVIKALLAHVLGAPLDLLRRIEITPCSISRIVLGEEDAKVLCVNLEP